MSVAELQALWRLHLVDSRMVEISRRLKLYQPTAALRRELQAASEELARSEARVRSLQQEAKDIELQDRSVEEKIKRFEKDLYGGKVVNPREVEAIQKEIRLLKDQRGELDVRLLELWEMLPSAEAALEEPRRRVAELSRRLESEEAVLKRENQQLEEEYRQLAAARRERLEGIPQAWLARYEAIRQRQGGVAMADVTSEGMCGACGTTLPRATIEQAKAGNIATCQECHRIVYVWEGTP
ncbi:MAG: C4-type zinc ribbon domain-containing protein [Fimbriimonadales bacterium]|nr:C4-type zinc ribbon domain-containing protein [Fimbriimonadales bacterium]